METSIELHLGLFVTQNRSNLYYDWLTQFKMFTVQTNNRYYTLHTAINPKEDISGITLTLTSGGGSSSPPPQ